MDFQVRKGLETPLKVHGMSTKFFCIYCVILAVMFLLSWLPDKCHEWGGIFFVFIVRWWPGRRLCGLADRLYQPFTQRKFGKFKRQVFVISNKDLLNSL